MLGRGTRNVAGLVIPRAEAALGRAAPSCRSKSHAARSGARGAERPAAVYPFLIAVLDEVLTWGGRGKLKDDASIVVIEVA